MTRITGPRPASRQSVTACLIVQNEAEHIAAALDSVSFCDATIVVDGGSTDKTVEIARATGATVIENAWPGFAAQRNIALDAADTEWVLELDADERVSPQLRTSIEAFLAAPPASVNIAVCPLRNRFLGARLGPSAKYPAYRSRLFRRDAYRHDESRTVHEGIEPRERPVLLDGDLDHELAANIGEAVRDAWRYARLESSHLPRPERTASYLTGIVLRPGAKLAYRTIVDQGWRDGWRGMLKIALDASSDALVWIFLLPPRSRTAANAQTASGHSPTDAGHFGRRPAGEPKIVAIAGGPASARAAQEWLAALQKRGLDVTLITDQATLYGTPPVRTVRRLRPLATMSAVDLEMQLRAAHAVVPVGRRATLVWRLLPGSLRPGIPNLDAGSDPALAADLARASIEGARLKSS